MEYKKKFNDLVKQKPLLVFKEFLLTLKSLFEDYLKGKVDDLTVSNLTVFWYATSNEFSDELIELDHRIKDLGAGMDITHPDFSEKRKKMIIEELIRRIDEILTK